MLPLTLAPRHAIIVPQTPTVSRAFRRFRPQFIQPRAGALVITATIVLRSPAW